VQPNDHPTEWTLLNYGLKKWRNNEGSFKSLEQGYTKSYKEKLILSRLYKIIYKIKKNKICDQQDGDPKKCI
jgi:hypothetical protein